MTRGRRGDGDEAVRRDVDELLGNHRSGNPLPPDETARGYLDAVLGMVTFGIETAVAGAVWQRLAGHGVTRFLLSAGAWIATGLVTLPALVLADRLRRRLSLR